MVHFWTEDDDNIVYKAIFVIAQGLDSIVPGGIFQLPELRKIIAECDTRQTKYLYWNEGKISIVFDKIK